LHEKLTLELYTLATGLMLNLNLDSIRKIITELDKKVSIKINLEKNTYKLNRYKKSILDGTMWPKWVIDGINSLPKPKPKDLWE